MTQPQQQSLAGQQVYVSFLANIDDHTTSTLLGTFAACATQGAAGVYLMLSTQGGNVTNGITLYNVMRAMPYEITTHNVGDIASIGNAVFLAGAKRFAAPNSTFMFHGVSYTSAGEISYEKDVQHRLDSILSDQSRIGEIITARTKIPDAEVKEMFRQTSTKDATYALNFGVIDEIKDLVIPPGCPVFSLIF
jgi:ATP-dependent protease ClpP protease subunit